MKIAAFDVETCQCRSGSICSVGVVMFEDGVETESYHSLVRPHEEIFKMVWRFEEIHGINRWAVYNAPEFPAVYEELRRFFSVADIVVGHNIAFDLNHLKGAAALYGIKPEPFVYACSLQVARNFYPQLKCHKLNAMAEHFSLPLNHHDALDDARVSGRLLCLMTNNSPMDKYESIGVNIKQFT